MTLEDIEGFYVNHLFATILEGMLFMNIWLIQLGVL
jgi:hypothetical protein